ncbi:MAG TPA: pirin-like C-terminal cupin domain-containing protein, partial [Beijerinckiaceae bacterium]
AQTPTTTVYADVALQPGAAVPFDASVEERGLYVASGAIDIEGDRYEAGRLIVLRRGAAITIRGLEAARLILLGGEPMDGPRFIWWNFVSSSKDAMVAAADAWERGRMPKVPGDEDEFIPMRR